jgi:hypothetical protein
MIVVLPIYFHRSSNSNRLQGVISQKDAVRTWYLINIDKYMCDVDVFDIDFRISAATLTSGQGMKLCGSYVCSG